MINAISKSLLPAFFAVAAAANPVAAQVEARVLRTGLFAGGDPVVRPGAWTFVEVELRYLGATPFEGELRLDQRDVDGDVITSVLPVALAPGGNWRRYELYFVPYESSVGDACVIRLYDENEERVPLLDDAGSEQTELTAPSAAFLRPDDLLVVDLSSPRLPHLSMLDMDRLKQYEHINPRKVRVLSPRELPGRWLGLAAVDAIVWDDADPSELSPTQIAALIEWVKSGGRLLVTAGSHWQSLADSPLAAALPVTITGSDRRREAQEFLAIVDDERYAGQLDRRYMKVGLNRCRLSAKPGSIPIPAESPLQQVAYRRFLGRGSLVFVGATLRELLPTPKRVSRALESADPGDSASLNDDRFSRVACEKVIARRLLALPQVLKDQQERVRFGPKPDLFQFLRSSIAFESVGTKFLIFAIFFAIAYVFAAIGSHWYLRRRSWEHHGWTAFGMVAIVASVMGTGMVGLLRGVTTKLWQTTIVDARAGLEEARAFCLFGVKTPNHTRLDVRLPVGSASAAQSRRAGPIQAVAGGGYMQMMDTSFAAAANYQSAQAGEGIVGVPVRATLKELQGAWHGPMGGVVDGRIILRRRNAPNSSLRYDFDDGSFIRNGLGRTLNDCFLLETSEEVAGQANVVLVNCHDLGDIAADGPESELDVNELRRRCFLEDPRPGEQPKLRSKLTLLNEATSAWAGPLRSVTAALTDFQAPRTRLDASQTYCAALLISTYDLLREGSSGRVSFTRSHGRPLACTHQLTSRTALLIGRVDDADPPAVLEVDRTDHRPNKSITIYRVVIPVTRR